MVSHQVMMQAISASEVREKYFTELHESITLGDRIQDDQVRNKQSTIMMLKCHPFHPHQQDVIHLKVRLEAKTYLKP